MKYTVHVQVQYVQSERVMTESAVHNQSDRVKYKPV